MFFICFVKVGKKEERDALSAYLKSKGVEAYFHYISLHSSPYWVDKYAGKPLPQSDYYTDCLLRLPLYPELSLEAQAYITKTVQAFYSQKGAS